MPPVFSGGTTGSRSLALEFPDRARQAVDPRIEVVLDARTGVKASRTARGSSFRRRLGATIEFEFRDVADNRGSLAGARPSRSGSRARRELVAAQG